MNLTVTKKNIRRTGIPSTKNGRPLDQAERVAGAFPTPERIRVAGEANIAIGGDDRSGKRYVMRDSPLDRALSKRIISGAQHSALSKYRHHWYHGGQAPHVGSIDLNRVFSSEGGNVAGMPASEAQYFHRERWREAREKIGERSYKVVTMVACSEINLEECGTAIGWNNKAQAISAATEIVREAADRMATLWSIG